MKVYIIGTGMEGEKTLTKEAEKAINEAQLLIGAERMLKPFIKNEKEYFKSVLYDIYNDYRELNPLKVNEVLKGLEKATCLIQQKNVLEVLNNFDPKDAGLFLSEKTRIFKEHVKDWWKRKPTEKEIEELLKRRII